MDWPQPGRREASDEGAPAGPVPAVADWFYALWSGDGNPETASVELRPVRLTQACVQALPASGAGLSLSTTAFRVPLGASDDIASHAERLQFTQGEGPCLDAALGQRMLVVTEADIARSWPSFAEQLFATTPYRALISLPLHVAPGLAGALDLYLTGERQLAAVSLVDAAAVTDEIGQALGDPAPVTRASSPWADETEPRWLQTDAARRRTNVWVAMGMLMSRVELTAADALATLRAHAYGRGEMLDDVADALVGGRLEITAVLAPGAD